MNLKILNKQNFIQKFLSPISRISDICTLTLEKDKVTNLNRTPDNTFSLYAVSTDVEFDSDKRNVSFSDIKRFIKLVDTLPNDTVIELKINENNIEYISKTTKFKYHLINDNIVRGPNFNIDKINALKFNFDFKLNQQIHSGLLKSSTFITNSNKIYIANDESGNVIGELTDKTKSNIDSYTTILAEGFNGEKITKPLAFDFELFRSINIPKESHIDIHLNTDIGIIAFDIEDGNYKLKYISTAHVS